MLLRPVSRLVQRTRRGTTAPSVAVQLRFLSGKTPSITGEDEWNDAWELSWLPETKNNNSSSSQNSSTLGPSETINNNNDRISSIDPWDGNNNNSFSSSSGDIDPETKAFIADMDDRWAERRAASAGKLVYGRREVNSVKQVESRNKKAEADEYRLSKQRIHAGLWVKEIERMEEAKLSGGATPNDDIDRLLDSCAEIFDSGNIDLNDSNILSTSELKTKPDGWEATSKNHDGNIWNITQREEDVLLQEFERRMAFSKFQIASFIKTHIFSRRRPVDGWKYMIEVIGPNARKGKGSVQRLPSVADPSTERYREEKPPALSSNPSSFIKGR